MLQILVRGQAKMWLEELYSNNISNNFGLSMTKDTHMSAGIATAVATVEMRQSSVDQVACHWVFIGLLACLQVTQDYKYCITVILDRSLDFEIKYWSWIGVYEWFV